MRLARAICCAICVFCIAAISMERTDADEIADRARALHFSSIVIDTHADTTQRLLDGKFDIGERHSDGHVDIPRMREGGLNAQFFSIWMSGKITGGTAVQKSLDQIDAVQRVGHEKSLVVIHGQ